ncbi:MAG TPA: amino acid adenylation domain-containing protein, partial [Anaerolineae bacterium]|nr:amino acid adenylation domain-containing protein [Anaerolineae bacterium]
MTLVEFLAQLRSLDVKLWVEDDRLRVNAPAGVLTPALRVELAARKAEVIAFLQGTQTRLHAAATPIAPVSRADPLPLSFAQQRMWFLYQLDPDSSFYNIPIAVRLNGPLDPALLEKGLNAVVSRHESLRTTFTLAAEQAVQVIAPELAIPLTIIDLRAAPAREHEAQQYLLREVTRPFDLATGPLLRATLLQLADEEHVLLLTMHHIVSDSWSGYVLVRELAALYQAERAGEPSPLPALPIQYADFAVWQRGWLRGEFLEAQLAYWKQQLAGASGVLDLPSDHPRPAVQSFRGSMQAFVLPETLHEALNALSRREGVTLFMTLLAAFNVVLNRYSAQADIVVGSPIANRSRSELEGLIGVFVNTLALRTNLGGDPTFTALLARVRDATLGAYAHQDLPFELLVEELRPERDLSRSPIFQVMFVFQNTPKTSVELSGLTLSPLEVDRGTAQFDLTLVMDETDHGLAGALEYNTDLFEAATIARLIAHFQIVLEAIAADPDRRIAQLPLLTDAERRQVLVEWNATQVEYRHDRCIQQLFEEQAERTPDAAAVVFADRQLTYRELNERANCLAHYLQHLGVKPEVLVGLCLERSLELLVGLLGILKAGGTYVPLDPSYPAERLSDMLADSGVPVLLTQAHLADRLHALRTTQYGIRIPYSVLRLDTDWPAIAQSAVSNPQAPISPDNLAYVIYTSGSTGRPKGVAVSHRNLVHSTLARMAYYPEAVTGFLLLSSFAFDSSLAGIFWTLCQGGRLILPEPGAEKDVPAFSALMAQRHPSHLLCVPNLYALLLAEAQPQLQELRVVIVAGEACSPELVEQHARLLPQTRLFNEYGPTEAAVWCSVYDCRVLASGAQVPIGRPIANTQLYILDAHLNPTPVGVPGELHVGGLGLARGYLNRPDLTAEKFIPNPFFDEGRRTTDEGRNAGSAPLSSFVHRHSSSRLYRTGDLARWRPDG